MMDSLKKAEQIQKKTIMIMKKQGLKGITNACKKAVAFIKNVESKKDLVDKIEEFRKGSQTAARDITQHLTKFFASMRCTCKEKH